MLTVLLIALTICLFTDAWDAKIYDFITYPLIITGILCRIINHDYVFAFICTFLFLVFMFMPHFAGAGDKKLWVGILLATGINHTVNIIVLAHILVVAAYFITDYFLMKFMTGKGIPNIVNRKTQTVIPMGPAYTLAAVAECLGFGLRILV